MASIQKQPNGKWRARYRDDSSKEHARHFARKIDAQQWLDDVTTARNTGIYVDPAAGRATVGLVAQTWLANPAWKPTTRASNENMLSKHVLPRWGAIPVSKVTHDSVQSWVNGLTASGLSASSVRRIHSVLSGILARAVRSKRLAINPAQDIDLPKLVLNQRRYLTAQQVAAFASAAESQGDIVLVLAYCGLRFGELAALRVRHVNTLRRRLTIEANVTEPGGILTWGTPKDHERRTVAWPAFLDSAIQERMVNKSPDDLLFTSTTGGVLRNGNMRRSWWNKAATASVGMVTPHELRHTCASLAVSAGASVLAVSRMLGHASAAMTLDVYADLFDADLDAVAERLSESFADCVRTGDLDSNIVPLKLAL